MEKKFIVGVDLGGTKIISGIVALDGKVAGKPVEVPTKAKEPSESIVGRLIDSVREAMSAADRSVEDVLGIGIGSPGPLDFKNGIIISPQNLPTLHGYRLKAKLADTFKIPVYVNNDANCFVLGECYFGAARGVSMAFGITLGTGFGCGIVIDKKIYAGATDTAAEIDLCPYLDGNLEDYISGRGVSRMYRERTGKESSPPEIADRARKKDEKAIQTWEEFGSHLGTALSYAVNILDPAIIIVGGSLSNAYELFSPKMTEVLMRSINKIPQENIKIVKAGLGNYAGFIGAACLVLQESRL